MSYVPQSVQFMFETSDLVDCSCTQYNVTEYICGHCFRSFEMDYEYWVFRTGSL